MKSGILILVLASGYSLFAQAPVDAVSSNLVVVQKEWRVGRMPPVVELDSADTNPEAYQRKVVEVVKENEVREKKGMPPLPAPDPPRRGMPIVSKENIYSYKVRLKNTSDKIVRSVTWHYVFYEPGTRRELGRRKFTSKTKIKQGKEKKILIRSLLPPTYIVGAKSSGTILPDQYSEEIIIRSIEYTDGSVWRNEKN